jgi:hypothetical protein
MRAGHAREDHVSSLQKRATQPLKPITDVRQVTRKPKPPIQHLDVDLSRFVTPTSGDDDASSHSRARKASARLVHGRKRFPIRINADHQRRERDLATVD